MEIQAPPEVINNHSLHAAITAELEALGFSKSVLEALGRAVSAARLVNYAPGDTIYHENSEVEALYVVRDGRIKLVTYMENGRARIVRLHNRGSVVGLNGLLDEPYAHTALAIDEVNVYQLPMNLIKSVKDVEPEIYCQLLEYWHQYLNMADTWITDFSTGAIRGRVARLIMFLVEFDEDLGPREVTLLTVEEMADILGVTPESVSRVMADMKRNRILNAVEGDSPDRYLCNIEMLNQETEN